MVVGTRYDYHLYFYFLTNEGKKVTGELSQVGKLPMKYNDISTNPYPIDVVYVNDNPNINLSKSEFQLQNSVYDIIFSDDNLVFYFIFILLFL